ncbi:MAG: T9SS type A sorting domain-containing protein [Bacteroidales bacterium]|nr:T9SS type A sorting domain-containing protein [Bacteroidales bacterium]
MKKLFLLFAFACLSLMLNLQAQPFEQVSIPVHAAGRPALAWGDYDNDGDLDFVLGGLTPDGSYLTKIYRNDAGVFVADSPVIAGIKDGSVAWGDYDNDSDLDLLISGETEEDGDICLIYQNTGGVFTKYDAGLPGIGYGEARWGDYDNDGDLDILIAGNWIVELYENTNGIFTETDNDFGFLQNAKTCWGDFDNDGDLDILLTGDTGGGYLADVFLNNKGTFNRAYLDMTGVISGTADMVDFDNDGDLDISISGFDLNLEPQFFLYENPGDGTVVPYFTVMEGIATSTVDFGDYDNDGDLDILMAGKNAACGASIAKVYRNDEGFFMMENAAQMEGAIRCNAAWADYDNDGDLDFVISGMTLAEYPFTKLYRNEAGANAFSINTLPDAPASPETLIEGQTVTFFWDKAYDNETPRDGLYYNLRLGMHTGQHDLITPMADIESGFRFIQAIGNACMQTSRTISGLPEGTYFWSVQTIDQAFAGSAFSEERSFTIVQTAIPEVNKEDLYGIYPTPASNMLYVRSAEEGEMKYEVISPNGQMLLKGRTRTAVPINLSSLSEGIYFIRLYHAGSGSIQKFIKK